MRVLGRYTPPCMLPAVRCCQCRIAWRHSSHSRVTLSEEASPQLEFGKCHGLQGHFSDSLHEHHHLALTSTIISHSHNHQSA